MDQDGSALIIGASRGIGFGLARELLARSWHVIATARGQIPELTRLSKSHANLALRTVDINIESTLSVLGQELRPASLDLLLVSAGVSNDPDQTIAEVTTDEFVHVMTTNVLGPMRAVEALCGAVRTDGVIVVLSSGLGSVAANETGGREVYRASKAALNSVMRSYAARNRDDSRTLLLLTPGWVRTDMGGPTATLDVETSARGLIDVAMAQRGAKGLQFLDYTGKVRPW